MFDPRSSSWLPIQRLGGFVQYGSVDEGGERHVDGLAWHVRLLGEAEAVDLVGTGDIVSPQCWSHRRCAPRHRALAPSLGSGCGTVGSAARVVHQIPSQGVMAMERATAVVHHACSVGPTFAAVKHCPQTLQLIPLHQPQWLGADRTLQVQNHQSGSRRCCPVCAAGASSGTGVVHA